jgi:hypothetical protein
MASIIKANINLNEIPKDKIYKGKKGSYLPITITINDEVDQFGNQGPVVVEQSKEEREAKVAKVYLGNVKVVWTNGDNVAAETACQICHAGMSIEEFEFCDICPHCRDEE